MFIIRMAIRQMRTHSAHKTLHNKGNSYSRKMDEEKVEVAKLLRELGWSYQRIADALGLSFRCIFNHSKIINREEPLSDQEFVEELMRGSVKDKVRLLREVLPHSMSLFDKYRRIG